MLFLGREASTPLDLVTGLPLHQRLTCVGYDNFVQLVERRATEANEVARKQLRKNADRRNYRELVCSQKLKGQGQRSKLKTSRPHSIQTGNGPQRSKEGSYELNTYYQNSM